VDELGKLLQALQVAANRTAFRNGQAVPGVNLGAIPAPVINKLRGCSDGELKLLSDLNVLNLANGLVCGGAVGIGAV
jgi:hypothetical protein